MPVMDGIAVTYYLKYNYLYFKIIGLSNYFDENSVGNMLLSGADGFIMKALAETIMEDAVQTVMRNEIFIDNRMEIDQQHVTSVLNNFKKVTQVEFGLTERERTFIILNATTLTYRQIAEIMFVETKTIQTYYDRISKKLKLSSRQALTLFSLQNGLATLANYTRINF